MMDFPEREAETMDEILIAVGELCQSAKHYAGVDEHPQAEPNGQAGPPVAAQVEEQPTAEM